MIGRIQEVLGSDAEGLLSHQCKTISKDKLHLPGPDFIDRIFVGSDRSTRTLVSLQHGAGLGVQADSDVAEVSTVLVVRMMGFLRAPCRVVYVIDEPDIRGFAYGTLPGHPECGEERFVVRYDPDTSAVYAEVSAFSRPATWWSKAGGPFVTAAQRLIAKRYVRGIGRARVNRARRCRRRCPGARPAPTGRAPRHRPAIRSRAAPRRRSRAG